MMTNKEEKKDLLFNTGKEYLISLKHVEFECPLCGGIATVYGDETYTGVECHACSVRKVERG